MPTDVVYILGSGSGWDDNELRFSLRSLAQFMADIGNIYVVGARPRWLANVIHIPYKDRFRCKERSIMIKLAHACGHPDLSQTFLAIHDDHFCLRPTFAQAEPFWAGKQLEDVFKYVSPRNPWRYAIRNTFLALRAKGLTEYNFDIHRPMLIDKTFFPQIMDLYDWPGAQHGFLVKSLYANTMKATPTFSRDLKINRRYESFDPIVKKLRSQYWFSVGNEGLTLAFKEFLSHLYADPCWQEL